MITKLELDIDNPDIRKILEPSLDSDSKVNYSLEAGQNLNIRIETDSLGPLRGSTDTAFRLAMLADKIYSR